MVVMFKLVTSMKQNWRVWMTNNGPRKMTLKEVAIKFLGKEEGDKFNAEMDRDIENENNSISPKRKPTGTRAWK